jgi:D-alanyl-D-alanine carboxypeptidase (penicillin-binding protein 5/6)
MTAALVRRPAAARALALGVALIALTGLCAPAARAAGPALSVSGAALTETQTGQELFGRNAGARLAIASTTKIMTAWITLQHVRRLGVLFTQNDYTAAAADSQIGLVPGERMSVHDLLLALLLPSADDAAEDLAYNVGGGSVARFVAMMNAEARRLRLTQTHYSTPIGLDTPGNYSSALDLDRLAAYVIAHSAYFRQVIDLPSAVLRTGRYRRDVVNRNDLVGRYPWITGVKTGHTLDAGYVLVASGTRDGMTLIGSVLGTASAAARDHNALALLDWGFSQFQLVAPVRAGEVLARRPVSDSSTRAVLIADASFRRAVSRSQRVTVTVKAPRQLAGPLPRHAIVGQATVRVGGRAVARIPLVLARALPAVSALTQAGRFLTRTSTLVWLVLIVLVGLAGLWRRKPRALARGPLEEG